MTREHVGLVLFFSAVLAGFVMLATGAGALVGAWLFVVVIVAVRLLTPSD